MPTVIKTFDPWRNERHTFCGPEEESIAEARDWAWEGCRIERWQVSQMFNPDKLAEIPLTPEE